ncbi:MAG: DUF6067 family protein [Bacteroides sp.]|nr:DUF6067 family protein [Bacteroides sp.]
MRKTFYLLLLGLVGLSCVQKQSIKTCSNFTELDDPMQDISSNWDEVANKGLMASFISIDEKPQKSILPAIENRSNQEKIVGWKGETLSSQILLWSNEAISQIELSFSDFKSESATLPSSIAEARFVRYILTEAEYADGCSNRPIDEIPLALAPDMLDNLDCFDMDGKTVRPVWLSIYVPHDATPGLYDGEVYIQAKDQKKQTFNLTIEVLNQELPQPSEWSFHLDQWQHPAAVARVHDLEVWSDAHFQKMEAQFKLLADAGQKVITATLNKDPWNHQCYDEYKDMIIWTKHEDNSWTFDYTVFDRWVQLMMDLGINGMINCYSMIPWGDDLHYRVAETDELVTVEVKPGSEEFNKMWSLFLPDFVEHLRTKGWLAITNISMDERSPEAMEAMLNVLQEYAPELGISLADNHQSYKRYPFIKDLCVAVQHSNEVEDQDKASRREKGLITTIYSCCGNDFPNQFTYSPSAESAFFGWYAEAAHFDGCLRWAYNSWVENPLVDARSHFPSGDSFIVYPDARSSIRNERLIEGIQDYEKIQIIKRQLIEEGSADAMNKLDRLNKAIAKLRITERNESWLSDLNAAKATLIECAR